MHGTRKAARLFDAYVIDSFATAGLQQLDYMHMTFVLPELDLEIAVNSEDFVAEGVRESRLMHLTRSWKDSSMSSVSLALVLRSMVAK